MVVVMVVLLVVLQAGRVTRPQLGQSAAGRGELGAQVSHLLAGWLDGPIDPLSQLLVVFHHFQDFPLRSKSTQRRMVSSTLSGARRSRSSSLSPFCHSLDHTYKTHAEDEKNPKSVCPLTFCSKCQQERPNRYLLSVRVRMRAEREPERERERVKECDGGTKRQAGARETSRWKKPAPSSCFQRGHSALKDDMLSFKRNVPCAPGFWGERGRDLKYGVWKTRRTAALDFQEAFLSEPFVLGK